MAPLPASLLRNCDCEIGSVRRADVTARNAAELACLGPLAVPDGAGTLASDVAERAPERAEARPPRLKGDLRDGQVGLAEQRLRALDAPREQVSVRRDAERLLERPREVRLGDTA